MKKVIILLALISATIGTQAQTNNDIIPPKPIDQSKFSLGFKGAFGHSFLMPYSKPSFMPSWDAGLAAIYSPYEHVGFGLDAVYSAEGVRFENPEYTSETNLNYVRVEPKLIYFFRAYEKDFRPKVSISPAMGFLVNGSDNSSFKTFDIGAKGTIGFNYRLLRAVWLNIDGSYYQGLRDIYQNNSEKDLNGNVRLNLGMSFGF